MGQCQESIAGILNFCIEQFPFFLFLALLVLVSFLLGQGIMSEQLEEITDSQYLFHCLISFH